MSETVKEATLKRGVCKSILSLTIVLCACRPDVTVADAYGEFPSSASYMSSQHYRQTAHATASELEGSWQLAPRTLSIAPLSSRGSAVAANAMSQHNPARLRLQIGAHWVLRGDELTQQRYRIIDHPKLRRRSVPGPDEGYAYWEGRALVVKHHSGDGRSLLLDRYEPAGWTSLALTRRHIVKDSPSESFELRMLFHRSELGLP